MDIENKTSNNEQVAQVCLESYFGVNQLMTKGFGEAEKNIQPTTKTTVQPVTKPIVPPVTVEVIIPKDA